MAKKFLGNLEPFLYLFLIVFRIIHCISRLAFGNTEVTESEDLIFFEKFTYDIKDFSLSPGPTFGKLDLAFHSSMVSKFKAYVLKESTYWLYCILITNLYNTPYLGGNYYGHKMRALRWT